MDITKEMEDSIIGGTKIGGLRAKQTNYERQGKDFYRKIGRIGGATKTENPKGFAAMDKDKVRAAGRVGGKISKRKKHV